MPPTINPVSTTDTTPTITGTGDYRCHGHGVHRWRPVALRHVPAIVNEGAEWSCTLASAARGRHPRRLRPPGGSCRQRRRDRRSAADARHHADHHPDRPAAAPPTPTPTPTPTATPAVPVLLILTWTLGGTSRRVLARRRRHPHRHGTADGRDRERRDPLDPAAARHRDGGCQRARSRSTPSSPRTSSPGDHTFVVTVTADGAEPSIIEQPVTVVAPEEQKAHDPEVGRRARSSSTAGRPAAARAARSTATPRTRRAP